MFYRKYAWIHANCSWSWWTTVFCISSLLCNMNRRVLQFLQSTSVKGIPRIFRTKSYFLKTLWVVSVVSFLCVTAYHVYILTCVYFEYDSVISTEEYNVDLTGSTPEAVRLPDMTFCNMNPFAVDTRSITDIPSLGSYNQRVRDLTKCVNCSTEDQNSFWALRVALQTTSGYYMHIGEKNASRLSHSKDEFLASCTVEMLSGMDPRKLPCEFIANIVRYFDFMYYNCYTLTLPLATATDLYSGVVVVLHLNNQLDIIEQQKHLTAHYMPGQMSGTLLVLHQQNQMPVLIKDGISLPSGYFMSTKLRFIRRKRLASPYGSCAYPDDMDWDYQQMTCYADCLQELVFKNCGCIDYTSYNEGLELLAEAGFTPCLSVKQDKERLLENWMCMKRTHVNYTTHCLLKCPPLCEELLYHYDVSFCRYCTTFNFCRLFKLFVSKYNYTRLSTSFPNEAQWLAFEHQYIMYIFM